MTINSTILTSIQPTSPQPNDARDQEPRPVDNINFAFSLDTILAAQLQNVSRSLAVHGATPQNATPFTSAQTATAQNNQSAFTAPTKQPATPQPQTASPTSAQPQSPAPPSGPVHLPDRVQLNLAVITSAPQSAISVAPAATTPIATLQTAPRATGLPGPGALDQTTRPLATNRAAPTTPANPQSPINHTNFARILAARLASGETRFEVRLDPAELGRIDVSLTTGKDNQSKLVLTFENQNTRDLFRHDTDSLRTLLSDINLDTEANTLEFNLAADNNNQQSSRSSDPARVTPLPISHEVVASPLIASSHFSQSAHLLNIEV